MIRSRVSLPFYVAQRYLRSTRRSAFITFLSLTAAGGIALGVASLILSSSALSGFQAVLKGEVMARSPHIEVTLPASMDLAAALETLSSVPGVVSIERSVRGRGWFLSDGRYRPVEVIGFEGALPEQFADASSRSSGLYVSQRLAEEWGLVPGEVVEVVSARPTLSPLGPQPRVRRIHLAGTFSSGRTEQEERIAVSLTEARYLFGDTGQRLLVTGSDRDRAPRLASSLRQALPAGATVQTWRDLNKALLFLLRLEKTLMFVAVFLIVVVAAMAVISDLMLILAHKQAEMGMLGAMGAPPETIRRIFLWLGVLLVAVGAALGAVLGVATAWLLDRYRLLSLPGDVYFLDHVPFLIRPQEVGGILLATILLTLGCSWWAARRAGALRPIEALHR